MPYPLTGSRPNPRRRSAHREIPEWTPCGYCFARWATVWDHLQPWSKGGLTTAGNLYPACSRCNGLLKNLSFESIQEKREYVRSKLLARGQWRPALESETTLSNLPNTLPEDAETPAVLQSGLPEKGLGGRSKKHDHVSDLPISIRAPKTAPKVLQPEMQVARMAQSKSGKHAVKTRTCRACLQKFQPKTGKELFCDKVCQESMGKGHDRLEIRLRELLLLEQRRLKEYVTEEIRRLDKSVRQIVREELEAAIVDIQTITDYGHSFPQGTIRPRSTPAPVSNPQPLA